MYDYLLKPDLYISLLQNKPDRKQTNFSDKLIQTPETTQNTVKLQKG